MSVRILMLSLAAWSGMLCAAPDNTGANTGVVRGTVSSTTGEPLRKARVSLRPAGPPRAGMQGPGALAAITRTTDGSGAFSFESVEPGAYQISAQRPGYINADGSLARRGGGMTIKVEPGQALGGIQIRLMPQGVISGRVMDEDGDPVMQATVQLVKQTWRNGRPTLLPLNADSTDDRGEYRISGLVPGRYLVRVNPAMIGAIEQGARAPDAMGDQMYAPMFYPGVTEISQATPLQIAAAQEVQGVDFRLRKISAWRVRGHVLDETGKPAQYVTIMAVPAEGGSLGVQAMGAVRGPEGAFEITGLAAGSYTLMVNQPGRPQGRLTGRVPVQVGNRDVDNLVVQLQRPFEVSGTVRVPAGVTLAPGLRVVLDPVEAGVGQYGTAAEVKADGTWSLQGLSPGRYRIYAAGLPSGAYLQSVLAGGQDITAGAQISAAASGIELVLAGKPTQLSVGVLNSDNQPVPNAKVLLAPDARDQYWLFRTAQTSAAGSVSFGDVVPGSYKVIVLPEGLEEGDWFDPDFLRSQENKGVAVKLDEGATETANITLG